MKVFMTGGTDFTALPDAGFIFKHPDINKPLSNHNLQAENLCQEAKNEI